MPDGVSLREAEPPRGLLGDTVAALVDACGRRPWAVLFLAFVVAAVAWHFALEVLRHPRTDLRELLPTDSAGLQAFERQLGRVGGGATLLVVVESPDAVARRRFVDALADRLEDGADPTFARLVGYVERGTKEAHAFFERTKWLYAPLAAIDEAYDALDAEIALRAGLVSDLADRPVVRHAGDGTDERGAALGLARYEAGWQARERELDPFPGGYFESADGRMTGLRIVSKTTGMGDAGGEDLLGAVRRAVGDLRPASPDLEVGFAGDIPNAVAEKDSVVGEAAVAGGLALALVVAAVAWFYRTAWAPLVVATPAIVGVGLAYAFAYFRFGYVNTTGMFLGAIILGNGINYPIVLLSRYREFVARGRPAADARREAAVNALRAELVGACVAAIAYGSLTVTQFRGFTQFGWIGFVGMLCVWLVMVPCVPAMLAILGPRFAAGPAEAPRAGARLLRATARAAARSPRAVVAACVVLTLAAVAPAAAFLHDPWEYNFDRLGSRESKRGGAGEWSNKAEAVFGGKTNVAGALMLADAPGQVSELKARILDNDARDPEGRLIAGVTTLDDFLPGPRAEQDRKIAALARLRERLTPAVLASLDEDERSRVAALRPPDSLVAVTADELPPLVRRRFTENDGRLGAVFYVRYGGEVSLSDGRNLLRIARTTDDVRLADGAIVQTASRSTVFAEMIRSMRRDGPRATVVSLVGVAVVVLAATRDRRGASVVLGSLAMAVAWLFGAAALLGEKLNYVNFIILPITFGIGCEYPFNVYDRARLLGGEVSDALSRVGGAVALCSFTTVVGYGSLVFADFQALQSFGRLAVCGELACLSGALLVVPAMLRLRPRGP